MYGKDGSNNAALQGQYLFQFAGTQNGLAAQPIFALGSLTMDGLGNITGGTLDVNSPGAVLRAVAVKGTYQFNVSGAGMLNLTTSQGDFQIPFSAPSSPSTSAIAVMTGLPSPTYPLDESAYVYNASVTAQLLNGVSGKGTLEQIAVPDANFSGNSPVIANLFGSYQSTLTGGTRNVAGMPIFFSGTSQFTFSSNGTVTDSGTLSANGITFSYPQLTGTYANFDQVTGRATMTLPNAQAGGPPSEDFAVYSFDNGQAFNFLSLTPRTQSLNVISGQGQKQ